MTDPAPLTDDELAAIKVDLEQPRYIRYRADILLPRAIATVEEARSQRDAAEAPSVELVQALLESENIVDRLTAERDAAYTVIRRHDEGWKPHIHRGITEWVKTVPYKYTAGDIHELRFDTAVEPMSAAEVDAIKRARATPEEASDE